MNCQLLTFEDLKNLILTIKPVEQSNIISKYIGYNIIVHKNGTIYELKDNVIYESLSGNIDEDILVKVSNYIDTSYQRLSADNKQKLSYLNTPEEEIEELSKDEKKDLKKRNQSKISSIFLNSSIKKYIPQLKTKLRRDDIVFDKYKQKIHYKNGYKCLKTLEFKQRINGQDFITKFIDRDYEPSTEEQRNEIMSHLKKIYVNDSDRDTILNIIGRCIAGLSAESAKNTFLLGVGSSGKSTCMSFCKLAFECYYKELKEDTFMKNNPKRDKIFNTYLTEKQILITCINEMIDENIDSSSFKKFIEGEIETTILYKDNSEDVYHQSGLLFTSNTMPKVDMADDGNERRVEVFFHRSLFIIDKNKEHLIDEKKNIFKGNKQLKSEIIEKKLLDAWADIIYEKSNLLINKKIEVVYSENFINDKKLVADIDNPHKDFILQELITDESVVGHLISKEDMLFAYKEFIKKPNSNILNKTLIDKFRCVAKELQIILKYDPSGRRCKSKLTEAESSKGCWINCRFKTENEKLTIKKEEKDSEPEIDEVKELERQIDELKVLLEEKCKRLNEVRTKEVQIIDEIEFDIFEDTLEDEDNEGEQIVIEELNNIDIEEIIIDDEEDEIYFENIYEEKIICDEINNLMTDMIYTTELRADHMNFNWNEDEHTINENISNLLKNIDETSLKKIIIPPDLIRNYEISDLENELANY